MIESLVTVVSCRTIGDRKYILADVTKDCYDNEHILYTLTLALPSLLLWGLALPLYFLKFMISHKNDLHRSWMRICLGFLYEDY
jgi:hypothetical protein